MDEMEIIDDILDEEEIEQSIDEAVEDQDAEKLTDIIEQVYPIDVALAIEDYDKEDMSYVIDNTDDETLASIFEQADEELSTKMANLIDTHRLIRLFEFMSKDDIADIIGEMKVLKRKQIINLMKHDDRITIEKLLGYDKNSAGGIMTTEYISVNINWSIKKVIEKIKEIAPKTEVIDTIFVVNNKHELEGYVDLREILVAPADAVIEQIMDENVIYVDPNLDQEEVALLVSKYDLKAIPVISPKKSILGIITVDDIIDVINEEHTEDMLQLSGADAEEDIESPINESIRMRLPWLFVNLLTAFMASSVVAIFEGTIAKVTALATIMPIITGMGGNAGSQQLAIMIRSIALGEIDLDEAMPVLTKQIVVALVNGIAIGLFAGIVLYFMYGNFYLGFIFLLSMIFNLIMAGVVGVLVPLILKKLKLDPALASAVFVTTVTDMFGFFVFLGLATIFLSKLI